VPGSVDNTVPDVDVGPYASGKPNTSDQPDDAHGDVVSAERRGTATIGVMLGGGLALRFLSQVAFARWMGVTEYGRYALGVSVAQVANITADGGLGRAGIKFIPTYVRDKDTAALNGFCRFSVLFTFVASITILCVGIGIFALFGGVSSNVGTPVIIGLGVSLALALGNLLFEFARGAKRLTQAFASLFFLTTGILILIAVLIYLIYGTVTSTELIIATGAGYFVSFLYLGVVVVHTLHLRLSPRSYDIRRWISVSLPLLTITGLFTLLSQLGVITLGAFGLPAMAGKYAMAVRIAAVTGLASVTVNGRTSPAIVSLHADGRHDELRDLLIGARRWAFWPALAAAIVVGVLAEPVLRLLGPAFASAHTALLILLAAEVLNAFVGPLESYLSLTGYHRQTARALICCTILALSVMIALIPSAGATGAAIGYLAYILAWNFWLLITTRRFIGLPWLPT
jgi:O-antigen/teichoic acid export membrane protein